MSHTLVLNSDFTPLSVIPISTITWNEAIKITYLGHADTVELYEHWKVHSPRISLAVPSVLVSRTYIKKSQYVRFTRRNLLIRDGFSCQYCGTHLDNNTLTIDHVIPRMRGGKTHWANVVCSCFKCNALKGSKSHMSPMRSPFKPDYYQLLHNVQKTPIIIPDSKWNFYLGWDPDLVTVQIPKKNRPE